MLLSKKEGTIFWNNLEKIKDQLLLDDSGFATSLGFKLENYLSYKKKGKTLPIDCLFELAEKFNFHLEDLLLKDDFTLKYDLFSEKPLLERYTLAPHSQTRAINNILNYVELTKGTRAKVNLIRKFQLSESFIQNEKNSTNVLLISDIVKYLALTHNFKNSDFIGIGRRMPFLVNNGILKEKLSVHKNAFSILECFVYECTKLFDTNCTYSIESYKGNYAVVNVIPNKNVVDELNLNTVNFGNEELCLTKMGNFSSTMFFKYGKNAPVKKINSIHSGHKTNQYLLELTAFNQIDKMSSKSQETPKFLQLVQ
ncbi:MAG: hypothetical protein K2Q18_14795 [Bdellovibrionales bacterium]|nr:hypothetical protein [Bdellovibrionales bacterium]